MRGKSGQTAFEARPLLTGPPVNHGCSLDTADRTLHTLNLIQTEGLGTRQTAAGLPRVRKVWSMSLFWKKRTYLAMMHDHPNATGVLPRACGMQSASTCHPSSIQLTACRIRDFASKLDDKFDITNVLIICCGAACFWRCSLGDHPGQEPP